ncbi:MAG: hypothetical protein E6713_09190 [Sporomusaceae bacterium]|nr:hypothetical protein [Sporomusaceae bacterium]
MTKTPIIGQIVVSQAGRDQGQIYQVVAITKEGKLLLADGRKRGLDHLKQKNPRHVRIVHSIATGEATQGSFSDLTVRNAIATLLPDKL